MEVFWRKKALIFVIGEKRLHCGDNDLRPLPVVTVLLIDDCLIIGRQQRGKIFLGLIFQFEPIHQEQDTPDITRAVEWDGLENRCGIRATVGSNPTSPHVIKMQTAEFFTYSAVFAPRFMANRVVL
jgi:hypothetical protein